MDIHRIMHFCLLTLWSFVGISAIYELINGRDIVPNSMLLIIAVVMFIFNIKLRREELILDKKLEEKRKLLDEDAILWKEITAKAARAKSEEEARTIFAEYWSNPKTIELFEPYIPAELKQLQVELKQLQETK